MRSMKKTRVSKIKQYFYAGKVQARILDAVFTAPDVQYSLTGLAAAAGVSKSTASRAVHGLLEEGVVELLDLGVVWRVKANATSAQYKGRKIVRNLSVICQSGIVDAINKAFGQPRAIVLYGSFRKGEDGIGSDVDIAVEADSVGQTSEIWLGEMLEGDGKEGLAALEETLRRKFMVTLFDRENVDVNLFNGIANGIVLSGFLEVKK